MASHCRITVDYVPGDEPHYSGQCICGVVLADQRMQVEILEAAYEHFVNTPHFGFMFIDFRTPWGFE